MGDTGRHWATLGDTGRHWVGVCTSERVDYLTLGVVVRRKWLGFEGRAGLMPRLGGVALSVLKVFISWATRPRPAQVGALPDGPLSSEAAHSDTCDAPISVKTD
ncbi:unnamed protein product [Pleuronectes platessa]|uniref:Uncharacterized protein n=1 Tax=Pleuronectes platessa TaxID=8262 RepID=A0A9N7UX65_PLEPL|nr:unnamed protein product [Pleuronectes platessa]